MLQTVGYLALITAVPSCDKTLEGYLWSISVSHVGLNPTRPNTQVDSNPNPNPTLWGARDQHLRSRGYVFRWRLKNKNRPANRPASTNQTNVLPKFCCRTVLQLGDLQTVPQRTDGDGTSSFLLQIDAARKLNTELPTRFLRNGDLDPTRESNKNAKHKNRKPGRNAHGGIYHTYAYHVAFAKALSTFEKSRAFLVFPRGINPAVLCGIRDNPVVP